MLPAATPGFAADYMPPPLFGGAPESVTITPPLSATASPSKPSLPPSEPVLPPPRPEQQVSSENIIPTPPPGVKGDIPLPPNVLGLDPETKTISSTKPIDKAPSITPTPRPSRSLETSDLINHPADHIDPLVQKISPSTTFESPAASKPAVLSTTDKPLPAPISSVLPRKTPAGLARPIIDGPGAKRLRPTEGQKKISASPKPQQMDSASRQSDEQITANNPDQKGREIQTVPSDISAPQETSPIKDIAPVKEITKADTSSLVSQTKPLTKQGIKSPSPTVRKIIEQNPKVMVYSRDKKTGEFKRVENSEHRVLSNKGYKSTLSTPKDTDIPPPDFIDDVMDMTAKSKTPKNGDITSQPGKTLPPPPVSPTSINDALSGRLVPLSEEDLDRAVISMSTNEPFEKIPTSPKEKLLSNNPVLYATKTNPINHVDDLSESPITEPTKDSEKDLSSATPMIKNTTPVTQNESSKRPPTRTDAPTTISFLKAGTELSPAQKSKIDDLALLPLSKDQTRRIEIRSYASADGNERASDRRIALARGLAVREYLKTQGISSDRIELKVLGTPVDQTPADRVELVIR